MEKATDLAQSLATHPALGRSNSHVHQEMWLVRSTPDQLFPHCQDESSPTAPRFAIIFLLA